MERREILWALELEQERAGRTDGEPPDSAYTDAPLVWDAATGETFARYEGHPHGAHDVTWSRDGQRVLTAGGRDGCVHVWQAHDGQLIARYQDEERSQQAITILRQALEEPNERKRSVLLNGAGAVQWTQAARWVADDTRIIATCALEVFVWDVTTGQRLVTYAVHRSRVNMLAVAPDGRRAASADARLVHVWNAERRGSTLFLYRVSRARPTSAHQDHSAGVVAGWDAHRLG